MSVVSRSRSGARASEDLADGGRSRAPLRRVRARRALVAVFPSGRAVWLRIHPPLASVSEANRLRGWLHRNDTGRALKRLARLVAVVSRRVQRRERELAQQIVAAEGRLLERIEAEADRSQRQLRRQGAELRAQWRASQHRHRWDAALIASALPLFAHFAQRGRLFGEKNLTLTLALGMWLFADDLARLLSGGASGSPHRGADIWSPIAPFGNLLTGWWLLRDQQHWRFVTGVAEVPRWLPWEHPRSAVNSLLPLGGGRHRFYVAQIKLEPSLAKDHAEDFRGYADVPAVATLLSTDWSAACVAAGAELSLLARVELGVLTLAVSVHAARSRELPEGSPTVAWWVDTRRPRRPEDRTRGPAR